MLTDLSWLAIGEKFPPASELGRLEMYDANKKLFEGEHTEIYQEQLNRIERVIGNFNDVVKIEVVLNFQRLMSLKVADLLFGEEPRITAGAPDSKEQKTVDAIAAASDLNNTDYMAAIDISRWGDGLLYIRKNRKGVGIIDLTQPTIWYPVVYPDNVREIQHHVLAWKIKVGKDFHLIAYIHSPGSYEEREYLLEGDSIKEIISEGNITKTGLSDFAIIQVPNITTSDRVTGLDDYTDVDSIISEIMVRVGQIERILDKHAAPSVTGPQSSLEQDPLTGEWRLKMGNYFPRDSEDEPKVEYLTWEGQLEANFKVIEKLTNMLYTVSEMGSALFGDLTTTQGNIPSGSALRRLMIAPLAKVNRIRMRFDPAIKKAIKLCSELGGNGIISLADTPISISWQDGLPGDPLEESQIMNNRVQKATMSQKTAVMRYDGLSEKDAEEEVARIQDEEAMAAPTSGLPYANGRESEPQEDEQGQE